jgi:cation diffusion facilitator CzcD-associated flavoprotein CzcO
MCDYLCGYAAAFDLFQYICLGTKVVKVTRRDEGHVLTLQSVTGSESEIVCDAIAVCSGLHVIPEMPTIEGIENVPQVFHSSEVKSRKQFDENTNVVVLGAGETAMDIAWLAITAPTKSVTLCSRDGFYCGPKVSQLYVDLSLPSLVADSRRSSPSLSSSAVFSRRTTPTSATSPPIALLQAFLIRPMFPSLCRPAVSFGSTTTSGSSSA